jgi:hypothetical protein
MTLPAPPPKRAEVTDGITTEEIKNSEMYSKVHDIFSKIDDGKDVEVSDEELLFAVKMELSLIMTEITISAGEKRQKTQFNPNDYFGSVKLDVSEASRTILERVMDAPLGSKVETYIKSKKYFYSLIAERFSTHEDFIRNLIQNQQRSDGINPH